MEFGLCHILVQNVCVVEYIEEYGLRNPKNVNNRIGNDGIILIDLNLILEYDIISLRELAKLFLTQNLKDEDFSSSAGKTWYEEMIEINKDDLLRFEQEKDLMKLQEALDIEEFIKSESKAKGITIGEAKGKTEEKLDIARNMLIEGSSIQFVAKCTGLTINQVKELKI